MDHDNIHSDITFKDAPFPVKTWAYPKDKDSIPYPAVYTDAEDDGIWIAIDKGKLLYLGAGGYLDKGENYDGVLKYLPPHKSVTITLRNLERP